MSLPVNLQNGLSSETKIQNTSDQTQINPIIPIGSNQSVLNTINDRLQQAQIQQYIFPLDLPKYNFTIIQHQNSFARDVSTSGIRRTLSGINGVYRLPLPTRLADSHSTEFNDVAPLDEIAALAKTGFGIYREYKIESVRVALEAKKASEYEMTQKIGEANKPFTNFLEKLKMVQKAGEILNAGATMLGISLANAKVVSLAEPNFRTFALSWNFAPKNYRESLEIQKICYNLKKNMTPERSFGGFVNYFPSVYTMFFQPNVKFLYKFKPCVLTSITVDYQPGEVPAFYRPEDNNQQLSPPQTVILNTTWLELDYFVQQHYDNDHNDDEDLPSNDPYGMLKDSFTFTG